MKTGPVGRCQGKARVGPANVTDQQATFDHTVAPAYDNPSSGRADMLSHADERSILVLGSLVFAEQAGAPLRATGPFPERGKQFTTQTHLRVAFRDRQCS